MTNTTYAKHFSDIDAVAINLPERKDRHDNIVEHFSDVFKTLSFKSPVTYDDYVSTGVEFRKRLVDTRLNHDPKKYFRSCYMFDDFDVKRFSRRVNARANSSTAQTPAQYARIDSLVKTVIEICKDFLASDKERIMILEDDAIFASDYNETIDIPNDADIIVWGGAMPDGYESTDTKLRASKAKARFKRLSGKHHAWHSQAYELTRKGAKVLSDTFESFPASVLDITWRYAFDEVTSYSVVPMAFLWDGSKSDLVELQKVVPRNEDEAKRLIANSGDKIKWSDYKLENFAIAE